MIVHFPYATLGHAHHGWLDARHHFSFASYHNPDRMGFGALRVINDDKIAAGMGFAPHAHDNMEIITYVRQGAISHKDSLGNEGRTVAGDVQVMSAGTGIVHSEYNHEATDTRLYQLWIKPNKRDVAPRWEAQIFPKEPVTHQLNLLVSGMDEHRDNGAMWIYADAAIYGGRMRAGTHIMQPLKHRAYILISEGQCLIHGQLMQQGDGAQWESSNMLDIHAITDVELLVIDVG
ncbi:MAG: pirin family protein [Alphaproteobacteria bacterium]|nr:MAG: pirin family protein [Alphaproteobacteria bacterium]